MSELEPTSAGGLHDTARSRDNELTAMIAEREGLPRNYRMRADAHYVEQLDRPPLGPAVRLIAARVIDGGDPPSAVLSSPLAESIATYGILQPLLVRRAGMRYQLIAGRKRLAAAVGAGLSEVPCIVHEISESAAQTLIETARTRATAVERSEPASGPSTAVLAALSQDLVRIGSLADVLELASNPFQHRAAADFLRAEAWRAAWLVSAAAIAANSPSGRMVSVPRALDRVRAGFEPEARLARLQLDFSTTPDVADAHCDEQFGTVASGLLFATLAWIEGREPSRVDIRVDAPSPQSLRLQIVQRAALPPHAVAGSEGGERHLIDCIAVAAARAFAATHGGSFDITGTAGRGAVIQLVFHAGAQA